MSTLDKEAEVAIYSDRYGKVTTGIANYYDNMIVNSTI